VKTCLDACLTASGEASLTALTALTASAPHKDCLTTAQCDAAITLTAGYTTTYTALSNAVVQ